MTSSSKNPHIYSSRAEFVSAADWNAFQNRSVAVVIDHTNSPYTLTNDVEFLVINTSGGAVTVNLPTEGEHPMEIKNYGSGANTVTLVASLAIENNTIPNGQCLKIIKTSLGWVTL